MVADEPARGEPVGGTSRLVRAAGGVLFRRAGDVVELALVHRPRYDDWSLPKGKLVGDEYPLVGAVREVWEETGVHAVPQLRLPSTRYLTGVPGVEKLVEYWAMRACTAGAAGPGSAAGDEVDEVRWMPPGQAMRTLSYAHDRAVVGAYAELDPISGLVVLIRHASAGERAEWSRPDGERPLDAAGRVTADRLATLLAVFAPALVVSAGPDRCVQTIAPLAAGLGLSVAVERRFNEDADPERAARALTELARRPATTIVCSQGKLIPRVVAALTGRGRSGYHTPKGAGWVLAFGERGLVGTALLDPPEVPGSPA